MKWENREGRGSELTVENEKAGNSAREKGEKKDVRGLTLLKKMPEKESTKEDTICAKVV